jgi:predicted Na+-dependent transporter
VSYSVDLVTTTKLLTSIGLVATMLAIGLKVHLAEIFAAARQTRLVLLALVANFLLVPTPPCYTSSSPNR